MLQLFVNDSVCLYEARWHDHCYDSQGVFEAAEQNPITLNRKEKKPKDGSNNEI